MIFTQKRFLTSVIVGIILASILPTPTFAGSAESQIVSRELRSERFAHSKVGTSPLRKIVVYLPAGYDTSSIRYPVIYLLPNPFGNYRAIFDKRDAQGLFDQTISSGAIHKFILVSADMTTPLGSSWYVNSSVTGNWEDFVVHELVPYIDANFKAISEKESRGIFGEFAGGYGAIRFGMKYPHVFGSVYATSPVGTGSGVQIMYSRPNWEILANAKSTDDLKADGFSAIFTSIFQAHLPNPNAPPLFIDLPARKAGARLIFNTEHTERLRNSFLLEALIPQYAENLKSLRGFKFDWARNDSIYDHVFSNQAFTHKLNEFGIPHEAEEFNGMWGEQLWEKNGRVSNEILPFFARHLVFDSNGNNNLK